MPTLIEAVTSYREQLKDAIEERGTEGKTAAIRSGKPIQAIHEAVKTALVEAGVDSRFITPNIGSSKGELTLTGFIKKKRQDVCVQPSGVHPSSADRLSSLLTGAKDKLGKAYMERTIAINVRSQFSSLAKNFDTLFERTVAEAHNLHMNCPSMVMGEVYMIAAPEFDVKAMGSKIWKPLSQVSIEKYAQAFEAINQRISVEGDEYKYERVCLLVVDFRPEIPIIYDTTESLEANGLIAANSRIDFSSLSWKGFAKDLLERHNQRFPEAI